MIDVDLAAGHEVAGRDVRDERVRHAGLGQLPGRQPGALQVRPRLVDPDVDRRARRGGRPGRPRARSRTGRTPAGPVLQWVRTRSGRSSGTRQDLQRRSGASRPWSSVASKTMASASARIAAAIAVAVLGQVADRLVGGHHPVDRPAEVDRRRARVAQGVGGAAQRRPARVRPRGPACVRRQGQPDRGDLADGRGAADDHLADGVAPPPRRTWRRTPRGRRAACAGRRCTGCPGSSRNGVRKPVGGAGGVDVGAGGASADGRIEDRAGRLGRRPLEGLGGPDDRRRAWNSSPGELAEEPPAPDVGAVASRGSAASASAAGRASAAPARLGGGRRSVGRVGSGRSIGRASSTAVRLST